MAQSTPDPALEEVLVQLVQDERFKRLIRLAEDDMDKWAETLAHGALKNDRPIDQREIDYKRGWYDGIMYYLKARPQLAIQRMRRIAREDGA